MVTVNFAVMSGSRAEGPSEKGAANLLAVSAFAGTGKRSGLKLMRDLENIGATVGTSVDREKITYKLTCLPEKAEEAVAAVCEVLTSPPTVGWVVEESKETADLVIAAHKACPESQVMELLHEAAYGENTPMGAPALSSPESLTAADVAAFRKANFSGSNVIVSATGLSIDALKTMAELYLHALPADGSKARLPGAAGGYVGGDMKVRDNSTSSSHLAMAFPVPAKGAEAYGVLHASLTTKIAAMPLPKNTLSAFYLPGAAGGLIGFYANGSAAAATSAMEAAVAELKALAASGPAGSADATKTALAAFSSLESGAAGAGVLLDASARGVSPVADARKVGSQAVAAAAKAALAAAPSYAVYGVTAGTPSYASVVKMTK